MKKNDTQDIKGSFETVEGIIDKLENAELPLEEAFKLYEEGVRIIRNINSKIDKVEKKLIILEENRDGSENVQEEGD